jgi:hypothetical protein
MDQCWSCIVPDPAEVKLLLRHILTVQGTVPFSRFTKATGAQVDSDAWHSCAFFTQRNGLTRYLTQHLGIRGKFFKKR